MNVTALNRNEIITRIIAASRKECPPIVEAMRMRNTHTGEQRSIFGMPFNYRSEDWQSVHVGFVFQDPKSNTTYGTVSATREGLISKHDLWEATKAHELRQHLDQMTDEQIQSQADYWLKE